jgi:hypothetical protein
MGILKEIMSGIYYDSILEDYWIYLRYEMLEIIWYDNILHLWRHYFLHQRCENCRNWQYEGRRKNSDRKYGICLLLNEFPEDYHAHCYNWNLDLTDYERGVTDLPDGWEMGHKTPAGKQIVRISKNGHWLYLRDGDIEL